MPIIEKYFYYDYITYNYYNIIKTSL